MLKRENFSYFMPSLILSQDMVYFILAFSYTNFEYFSPMITVFKSFTLSLDLWSIFLRVFTGMQISHSSFFIPSDKIQIKV